MSALDDYLGTHQEVRRMIEDLRTLLAIEPLHRCGNAKTAYELLCDLSERLNSHLTEADHGLYPRLLMHDDPQVQSLAWGFISGEKPLRQTFSAYYDRWLKHCEFNFNDEFLTETHQVCALVERHLNHEAQELIPKLIEIGMFRQALRRGIGSSSHCAFGRL
ncbi:hemerythrin domain-containing protein [uncultured Thiodictyon sp.]|uniref:hemerythrin domain-containing protein n=1 Tax=uncultured Thiodictyon sp. TaxID=1846217 RepID=UPI0025D9BE49|nr:hemerythrin domain-containing protein [uncultured Thiodictyon sp.]